MRWIVASIVLFLVPYTYITIKYRKPGKAFEPYADFKEQANVHRLNDAGYRRVAIRAERPFPSLAPGEITRGAPARPAPAPGGLPDPLGKTLVEIPLLPVGYRDLVAAEELGSMLPARIQFVARFETDREQLGGAEVFLRENTIVIVPTFEAVPGDLQARSKESPVLLTLPGGLLGPGEYLITLAGARDSLRWSVVVR